MISKDHQNVLNFDTFFKALYIIYFYFLTCTIIHIYLSDTLKSMVSIIEIYN